MGGFRIALESLGAKCVYSNEWDVPVQKVYAENFGDTPEGDITQVDENTIPDEQDDYKACCLNVRHSVDLIEQSFEIQCEEKHGLRVIGALYRLANGTVEFEI